MSARYQIVKKAVAHSVCVEAVRELRASKVIRSDDWHEELEPTTTCQQLADVLAKKMKPKVQEYKPNCDARGLAINRYLKTAEPVVRSGEDKDVYVLLALVTLDEANGLFQFSGDAPAPGHQEYTSIALECGDLLVWRGKERTQFPVGGGGLFATIRFD